MSERRVPTAQEFWADVDIYFGVDMYFGEDRGPNGEPSRWDFATYDFMEPVPGGPSITEKEEVSA